LSEKAERKRQRNRTKSENLKMSWLNKSLSHLQEISSTVSNFAEDVLAAELEVEKLRAHSVNGGSVNIEKRIEIDEVRRINEDYQSRFEDLNNQVTNLSEELEDSIAENDTFSKQNTKLSKRNSNLLAKVDELSKRISQKLEEADAKILGFKTMAVAMAKTMTKLKPRLQMASLNYEEKIARNENRFSHSKDELEREFLI